MSGKRGAHGQSGQHHMVQLEAIEYLCSGDSASASLESELARSKGLCPISRVLEIDATG